MAVHCLCESTVCGNHPVPVAEDDTDGARTVTAPSEEVWRLSPVYVNPVFTCPLNPECLEQVEFFSFSPFL